MKFYSCYLSLSICPSSPVAEQKNNGKVTLNCSVLEYHQCRQRVQWLYGGGEKISSDMKMSSPYCSAIVTFTTSHLNQKSKLYELFKCKVTDGLTKKEQLFTFSSEASGEKTGENMMTSN